MSFLKETRNSSSRHLNVSSDTKKEEKIRKNVDYIVRCNKSSEMQKNKRVHFVWLFLYRKTDDMTSQLTLLLFSLLGHKSLHCLQRNLAKFLATDVYKSLFIILASVSSRLLYINTCIVYWVFSRYLNSNGYIIFVQLKISIALICVKLLQLFFRNLEDVSEIGSPKVS